MKRTDIQVGTEYAMIPQYSSEEYAHRVQVLDVDVPRFIYDRYRARRASDNGVLVQKIDRDGQLATRMVRQPLTDEARDGLSVEVEEPVTEVVRCAQIKRTWLDQRHFLDAQNRRREEAKQRQADLKSARERAVGRIETLAGLTPNVYRSTTATGVVFSTTELEQIVAALKGE